MLQDTAVANYFINRGRGEGIELTNMQVQKLVAIAHGFYLAIFGNPLIRENLKAWQWGPVIPDLYHRLRKYGAQPITEPLNHVEPTPSTGDVPELLDAVWKGYKDRSAAQLSGLTHQPGTPWSLTWHNDPFGVIPEELIKKHYLELLEEA
jgi:uncharacterized phage-associated protein